MKFDSPPSINTPAPPFPRSRVPLESDPIIFRRTVFPSPTILIPWLEFELTMFLDAEVVPPILFRVPVTFIPLPVLPRAVIPSVCSPTMFPSKIFESPVIDTASEVALNQLPDIRLPSPAPVPPIWLKSVEVEIPLPSTFPRSNVPVMSVPIKFPCTVIESEFVPPRAEIVIPLNVLLLIKFSVMVLKLEPLVKPIPFPEFGRGVTPSGCNPIILFSKKLPVEEKLTTTP